MKGTVEGMHYPAKVRNRTGRARAVFAWIIALLVIAAVAAGFSYRRFHHAAVVRARPAVIMETASSTGPGMVAQVLVRPGDIVRKGQLLVVLDHSHLDPALDQAEQNVVQVMSQTVGAPVALPAPPPALMGGLEKRAVPIPMPQAFPSLPMANEVAPAPVNVQPPDERPVLQTKLRLVQEKLTSDEADVKKLTDQLATDKDAADAAEELVVTQQGIVDKTKAASDRSASLLAQGVISANDAAKSQTYAVVAAGQLQSAKVKAAAAESELGETQRALTEAQKNVDLDQRALTDLQAKLKTAPPLSTSKGKETPAASSNPKSATAPAKPQPTPKTEKPSKPKRASAKRNAAAAPQQKYRLVPVRGPLGPSVPPTPLQVNFVSPEEEAKQLQKAQATLTAAQQTYSGVCIYAPADGVVTSVSIRVGQMLQKGEATVTIKKQ